MNSKNLNSLCISIYLAGENPGGFKLHSRLRECFIDGIIWGWNNSN